MVEKRKFFAVELPIVNHEANLLGNTLEELNNRTVKLDLTRKLKGKSYEIIFRIKATETQAEAIPYRIHLFSFYIRRGMRKSIDYVEDSFEVPCANASLRIKPFLITRKKVSRAVRTALKHEANKEIIAAVKDKKFEDLFTEIIQGRFQRELSIKLKKIYPLALCEVRDIEVVKSK